MTQTSPTGDKPRFDAALARLRALIAQGDLSGARALADRLRRDPGHGEMGPDTMAGLPRRLHSALLHLARAEGDVVGKAGLQATQVPPPALLAPITRLDDTARRHARAMADAPIPHVLHQIWIGPHPVPPNIAAWQAQAAATGYEYQLWDEAALARIGVAEHPAYRRMLAAGDYPGAVDIARCLVLRDRGGIYLDADFRPAWPDRGIDGWLPLRGLIALPERTPRLTGRDAVMLSNALIGAPPGHPAMAQMLRAAPLAIEALPRGPAWWVTGPLLFTLIARQMPLTLPADGFLAEDLPPGATPDQADAACARARAAGGFMVMWKSW